MEHWAIDYLQELLDGRTSVRMDMENIVNRIIMKYDARLHTKRYAQELWSYLSQHPTVGPFSVSAGRFPVLLITKTPLPSTTLSGT